MRQCTTCHTFLYRGRKYNSRKEAMGGPDGRYLGITRWRFYIKCNHCSRPISFLTDPQNADYEMESGATRNYEIHRDKAKEQVEDTAATEKANKLDPMKALEDRVLDSQREMADLDNLEEIKAMNARHVQLMKNNENGDMIVPHQTDGNDNDGDEQKSASVALTEDDEALIKSIKFGKKNKIRRLDASDEAKEEAKRQQELAAFENQVAGRKQSAAAPPSSASRTSALPVRIKRKAKTTTELAAPPAKEAKKADLSGLLGGYGSSSSSE